LAVAQDSASIALTSPSRIYDGAPRRATANTLTSGLVVRLIVVCPLILNPTSRIINIVPMTLDQIVEEARRWPPEKVGELVGRLSEDLHASDPEIKAAWKTEVDRRLEEIQAGQVQGVPLDQSLARIRKIAGL
jgi:putative addiction module component (TIGR02574 family)